MEPNEKSVQFANFNITFGDDAKPMLEYFDTILMPAFKSPNLKRGNAKSKTHFSFNEVIVKNLGGTFVLCGNVIKETILLRHTTLSPNNELQDSPAEMPTAPFSRFVIFLENHRMLLIRNEQDSPDIRSFQATVKDIVGQYIKAQNKDNERIEKLPYAAVNIVDMPLAADIDSILGSASKIWSVRWRFFPLNGDIDFSPIFVGVGGLREKLGSPTAYLSCTSPSSKAALQDAMHDTVGKGLAEVRLDVTDGNGKRTKIKEDKFTSSAKIPFMGNVLSTDDERLVRFANEVPELQMKSPENTTLYTRMLSIIEKWMYK